MKVRDLALSAFDEALRGRGLEFQFGPFCVKLVVRESTLARTLHALYADYPVSRAGTGIVSFEVTIHAERRVRNGFWRGFASHIDGRLHARSLDIPLALPTLEWTINWGIAVSAHRYLMLHAAAVERDGSVLVIPGTPGSGKSTLCAALVGRGWRLFSDEFALVQPEDCLLAPLPRPISLKNRSIALIRDEAPSLSCGPIIGGTIKGDVAHFVPPADSINRQREAAPPGVILFPTWQEEAATPRLTRLSPVQAVVGITQNAMNYETTGEAGFRAVRGLVERCPVYRLTFGGLADALQQIEELQPRVQASQRSSAHASACTR